jgi:ABC-2 type transport system permease protein
MTGARKRRIPAYRMYGAVLVTALRQRLSERGVLVARAATYGLFLLVFSRLWQALFANDADGIVRARSYVWYLAVTELVALSPPRLHQVIDADVRRGEIAYHLTRPSSYLLFRLAEGLGGMLLGMAVLLPVGVVSAYLLTGGLPQDPRGLLFAVPLALLGACLVLLCTTAIGLTAFFIEDSTPVYWIWNKALFVLGGLIVPLALFPEWLRKIAAFLPFSALINGTGSVVFGFAPWQAALVAIKLVAWSCIAALALVAIYRRGLLSVEVNGG